MYIYTNYVETLLNISNKSSNDNFVMTFMKVNSMTTLAYYMQENIQIFTEEIRISNNNVLTERLTDITIYDQFTISFLLFSFSSFSLFEFARQNFAL